MEGQTNHGLRPRRALALLGALVLAACFDYAEQVTVKPTGETRLSVRYSLPDWLASENPDLVPDAAGLRVVYADGKPVGFEGDVAVLRSVNDRFVRRDFTVREGGLYRYEVRIAMPATYAAQVSASIERYAKKASFMNVKQLRNMRDNALRSMGPRFAVELPGAVLETNGAIRDRRIEWRVPLQLILDKPEIVLFAEGRLGPWQRVQNWWFRRALSVDAASGVQ